MVINNLPRFCSQPTLTIVDPELGLCTDDTDIIKPVVKIMKKYEKDVTIINHCNLQFLLGSTVSGDQKKVTGLTDTMRL